jgi:hypothetical protein
MLRVAIIAAALAAAPAAYAAHAAHAAEAEADPVALAPSAAASGGPPGTPASAADWTPLPPSRGAGLDFKDAATEPAPGPPPDTGGDARDRLIPALLALGALVVLLRKRPT